MLTDKLPLDDASGQEKLRQYMMSSIAEQLQCSLDKLDELGLHQAGAYVAQAIEGLKNRMIPQSSG